MSLTLGLNTALSGLLTSQRGLDVISQNVTNVNTKGYTRKVMNQESKVLNGRGSGVQEGAVSRMVSEGLLKDIRRQNSNTGKLEVEQNFYPRLDDLFGEVADNTSIAHKMNDLFTAFQTLGSQTNKPSTQWSTMQSAQDVADTMSTMTKSLQDMRVEADQEIEAAVSDINNLLTNIHDLNLKIVKNGAVSSGTSDLEDKRDTALSDLAKLVDIQYFQRSDGSMTVYSTSGQMLLDNSPQLLSYSASSTTDTWMTAAGGQFNEITVEGGTQDFGPEIVNGKLRALLDMRDKTLTNLQGSLDELSSKMKDALNLAHNRGTSLPNISNRYEGTRVFAEQGNIVRTAADNSAILYKGSVPLTSATYTTLAIVPSTTAPIKPWHADINATAGNPFTAAAYPVGTVFSIGNATDSANDGSYRVVSRNSDSSITVEKVNPSQTMQLQGNDDVVIATFDGLGNQLKQTTLNDIMKLNFTVPPNMPATPYTAVTIGANRSLNDLDAKGDHDAWAINEVSAHVEAWMRSQGYTNASVNLNSEGKMVVDVGDSTVSLAFRDQVGSTDGDAAGDATIAFDVNGDGANDETVKGFSNFFGLNDFYVNDNQNAVLDSAVQPNTFTTVVNRDLSLYDTTGKIGNTISVARGASLQTIADAINAQTQTNESVALGTTSWTLTSAATMTVGDASGTLVTVTLPAGTYSLEEIAGQLTQGTVTGAVVQDGTSNRLRLTDSRGQALSVSISGGTISGSSMSLSQTLDMTATQRIEASVVPEGSGYRLRIRQTQGGEAYASSTLDVNNKNLLSDIGLKRAATGTAANMEVRTDIQTAPEKISRGAMQWNADVGRYYLSEGDNTSALEMSRVMNAKNNMSTAGSIAAGKYSFAEYSSATLSVVAQDANKSEAAMEYQSTLNASLDFQNASYSGVNLDEEISAMMDFQQAYSASAKVISVLQEMLETLNSMIR